MGETVNAINAVLKIPGVKEAMEKPGWTVDDILEIPGVMDELKARGQVPYIYYKNPDHPSTKK